MLHLANPYLSPPGQFRIRDPELAAINPQLALVGPHHAKYDLMGEWNRRRIANGLPPVSDADAEDRICADLPPGFCRDELGQPTLTPGTMALTLADVAHGTSSMARWVANGMRRVPDDEIVRRSYLCNQCPWHRQIVGCQGCAGAPLRGLINKVVGGRSLPTDAMLQACGVCKCSLVAKTRMPVEDFLPDMSAHQRDQLWERCWIKDQL